MWRSGLACGIGAFTLWGVFPIYFHVLKHVPPWIILCHRVLWSAGFLAIVVWLRGEWPAIGSALKNRRSVALLAIGALLIAVNWLIFIYAVGSGQVLAASLGYFINPLVSVALGVIFLRERLRPLQWLAVFIALAGVLNLAARSGRLPWVALSLAVSFGLYGLVRKKVNINSLHGLLVETGLLVPPAIIALALLDSRYATLSTLSLLSASGIITATPLLLFGAAVRTLRLATIGFLQYIGPTLQFLLAIWIFKEPMNSTAMTSFILCWMAILVYAFDSLRSQNPQPLADRPE